MSGKAGNPAYFDPQDQKAYMKQAAVSASKKELIAKGNKRAPRYSLARASAPPAPRSPRPSSRRCNCPRSQPSCGWPDVGTDTRAACAARMD
jgi:hypothetical protein